MRIQIVAVVLAICFLCGCQTHRDWRREQGDRMARVLGDYIAFERRLPGSRAELQSFARGGEYGVRWRYFEKCTFHPVSDRGARVDFVDSKGISDYRVVF